jgi:hypothetical protein
MAGGTIDVPTTVSVPSGVLGVAPKKETALTPVSTSDVTGGRTHFVDEGEPADGEVFGEGVA